MTATQPQDADATHDPSEQESEARAGNVLPTSDLYMLFTPDYYSQTLLCKEQANELALFIRDATGVEVGIKRVIMSFSIYYPERTADGMVDDSLILDPEFRLALEKAGLADLVKDA